MGQRRSNERYQAIEPIGDNRNGDFLPDWEGELRELIAPHTVKRTRTRPNRN